MISRLILWSLVALSIYVRAPEVVRDIQAGASGLIQTDHMLKRIAR